MDQIFICVTTPRILHKHEIWELVFVQESRETTIYKFWKRRTTRMLNKDEPLERKKRIQKMIGKNMNSQRISFLSVAWLLLHSSYFLLPCGSCVTCLFLEGHFSIHLEVASDSFCFLINSSWLLVFILYVFFMIFSGFNLYCWKGIHFS